MPDHEPVRVRRFVEQRCAKWDRSATERISGQCEQPRIGRQRSDGRHRKEMTRTGPRPMQPRAFQLTQDRVDLCVVQNPGDDREAVVHVDCQPVSDDRIPDVRDGLTREQRVVLYVLSQLQRERGDRNVPTALLWGRVCEYFYISPEDLSEMLAQLGARKS